MNYELLINKKVNIIPLDIEGRIKEISIKKNGIMMLIRYLYNMEMYEAYFYEDELIIKET